MRIKTIADLSAYLATLDPSLCVYISDPDWGLCELSPKLCADIIDGRPYLDLNQIPEDETHEI